MRTRNALLSSAIVASLAFMASRTESAGNVMSRIAPDNATNATTPTTSPSFASAAATASPTHNVATAARRPLGDALPAFTRSGAAADGTPQAERARALLRGPAARDADSTPADGFVARDVVVDTDGTEHVRMERTYQGLPVIGGDLVLHSRDGVVESVSQNLDTQRRPALLPGIGVESAVAAAGALFDGIVDAAPTARLVVFARNVEPTLAYEVHVTGARNDNPAPGLFNYYIDAATGSLLQADDLVRSAAAAGTARTLTLGNVGITTDLVSGSYRLSDPSRGNGSTWDARGTTALNTATLFTDADNTWGNNATSDRATVAGDAHYGVAATWDFYKATFGRNGIFNNGQGAKSYVHYSSNLVNAYWNGTAMLYGDGDGVTYRPLVALDVAGHEMTHGVTQATANLGYYNIKDSGGLNEGVSDIFGTLVEYSVNNINDPGDFLMGEEIYINNPNETKALRLLFKQDADGRSIVCYPSTGFPAAQTGAGMKYDPHNTSGVANRAFYLMSQGAVVPAKFTATYTPAQMTCNGDTGIVGIGRAKAGAIWYRALTLYFVSTTTYPQARAATLRAAADLYGTGSTEYNTVARAWTAAAVN